MVKPLPCVPGLTVRRSPHSICPDRWAAQLEGRHTQACVFGVVTGLGVAACGSYRLLKFKVSIRPPPTPFVPRSCDLKQMRTSFCLLADDSLPYDRLLASHDAAHARGGGLTKASPAAAARAAPSVAMRLPTRCCVRFTARRRRSRPWPGPCQSASRRPRKRRRAAERADANWNSSASLPRWQRRTSVAKTFVSWALCRAGQLLCNDFLHILRARRKPSA